MSTETEREEKCMPPTESYISLSEDCKVIFLEVQSNNSTSVTAVSGTTIGSISATDVNEVLCGG